MRESAAALPQASIVGRTVWGLAPLVLLGLVLLTFVRSGPVGVFRKAFPPVEELAIERILMPAAGQIEVVVVNGGPAPVTVAQVLVDDAAWSHTLDGDRTIGRLQTRKISIPYPWVEGEPHTVKLLTSTGLTFQGTVDVATLTPKVDSRFITTFALLGIYVGVIPVFLGLLWLPFLRGVQARTIDFFLSLTVGLLVFLGVDALAEAVGSAGRVAEGFHGTGLVLLGLAGAPLAITLVSARRPSDARSAGRACRASLPSRSACTTSVRASPSARPIPRVPSHSARSWSSGSSSTTPRRASASSLHLPANRSACAG